jgi:hypothetical protein
MPRSLSLSVLIATSSISHGRFRVHAQAIQHSIDEIEVADAVDGIDELLVGEAISSEGVKILLMHTGRMLGQLHGEVQQSDLSLCQTCIAVIFLHCLSLLVALDRRPEVALM